MKYWHSNDLYATMCYTPTPFRGIIYAIAKVYVCVCVWWWKFFLFQFQLLCLFGIVSRHLFQFHTHTLIHALNKENFCVTLTHQMELLWLEWKIGLGVHGMVYNGNCTIPNPNFEANLIDLHHFMRIMKHSFVTLLFFHFVFEYCVCVHFTRRISKNSVNENAFSSKS